MKKTINESNSTIDEEKAKMLEKLANETLSKINGKVRNNQYKFNANFGFESSELSFDVLKYGTSVMHIILDGRLP